MNLLTFDPGKETGWAYFEGDKLKYVGSVKFEGNYFDFGDWVWRIWERVKPEMVVFEELLAFGARMSSEGHKLEAIIEYVMQRQKQKYETIHPSTVKKLITGKGNCKKADMRKVLKERIEIPGKSNVHIVDAVSAGLAWMVNYTEFTL